MTFHHHSLLTPFLPFSFPSFFEPPEIPQFLIVNQATCYQAA